MGALLKVIKAGQGDSLLLQFIDPQHITRTILIDGGNKKSDYKQFLREEALQLIADGNPIDLMVVTHIDSDHINGLVYLLEDIVSGEFGLSIHKVWFNSVAASQPGVDTDGLEIGYKGNIRLQSLLQKAGIGWINNIYSPQVLSFFGSMITVLGPSNGDLSQFYDLYDENDIAAVDSDYGKSVKELQETMNEEYKFDTDITNASSIALLWEYDNIRILFLGDSPPSQVDESIRCLIRERGLDRLSVDYVKLAHHGSRKSLSREFLALVDCTNYIISTNGSKSHLPSKFALSQILCAESRDKQKIINFYFNFKEVCQTINFSELEMSRDEYFFACHYPTAKTGNLILL